MEYYLFTARSITHAQQMAQELERSGVYIKMRRAGAIVTKNGCGYTLQVAPRQYGRASEVLREKGLHPVKVFHVTNGQRLEVAM